MSSARAEPPAGGGGQDGANGLHSASEHALDAINRSSSLDELEAARALHLGRGDGLLSQWMRRVGQQPPESRRAFGQMVQELVARADGAYTERRAALEAQEDALRTRREALDLTAPPPELRRGRLHPVTLVTREIRRIFGHLGYLAVEGPELEYDRYNFELVNMPAGHPARDTQDTFFVDDVRLLRTQTSPVQIRAMVSMGAPLRIIVPGKTYRRDYDATHFPMFHQCEGLCVDEGISVADLKGTLLFFARSMFGPERSIRLRPHHFPFTEPSLEVDVSCMACGGEGCRTCRRSGWIEILGCGMVHPEVLRNGGIDPDRFSGFAFGMGIERIAQLAYGVEDGRLFFENDVRFLRPLVPGPS
ncbi:MAG TPA: phenylalanine--tRNA ligase subunit alpha [Candidatus Dormibacteraeota bacterium]|nr:phenylalanine--tRNA ligase subunit alpha [Candidatus Dormibacteraeota bacterium]